MARLLVLLALLALPVLASACKRDGCPQIRTDAHDGGSFTPTNCD